MLRRNDLLAALSSGPKTNRQIQATVRATGADIARTMAKLIEIGRVRRADAGRGAGLPAIYELVREHKECGTDWSKHHTAIAGMMGRGYTYASIAGALGGVVSANAIKCYARRAGLLEIKAKPEPKPPKPKVDRTHMRGAASRPEAQRGGGMKAWRPSIATSDLERAVQKLRTRHHLVCAEDTIRYPGRAPAPYRETTLFRVGGRASVTAAQLVEMAG